MYKSEYTRMTNNAVMLIDPEGNEATNSKSHLGIYPYYMQMRKELHSYEKVLLEVRKQNMMQLFEEDFNRENEELRLIGKSYILNHP